MLSSYAYMSQFSPCQKSHTHLSIVAPQVAHVLACVRGVDLDRVRVHGGEVVPPVAEAHLPARLDVDLLERPDVVHEQVHQAELIGKAH
jgi:hypothetical protein